MQFIKDLREGTKVKSIYLIKSKKSATTKSGKAYETLILQDKSATIEAKNWDVGGASIESCQELDYAEIQGDVSSFNDGLQINIKSLRIASQSEYNPADFVPVSKYGIDELYAKLLKVISAIKHPDLHQLLENVFIKDKEFINKFRVCSAAKYVHHAFVGGLMQHTLAVARLCEFYCRLYNGDEASPVLNRDLLLTAALLHDIGKTRELSPFPANDYTVNGELIGHIVAGAMMIQKEIEEIPGFDATLAEELLHCILAHHGELEYGSPKKPALIEAVALNFADNTDAKMESFIEALEGSDQPRRLGYNKLFEANLIRTRV